MSAQTISDAFCLPNAQYKAAVMRHTWGHLAPAKNRAYAGRIIYAVGVYGDDELNPTMLLCNFAGLDDSPWFFDAACAFIGSRNSKPGGVYEFNGTFKNYEFVGRVHTLLKPKG